MLKRVILAVIVAVAVTLLCMLLGLVLKAIDVRIAVTVGEFLEKYAAAIGIISGIWYGFIGVKG